MKSFLRTPFLFFGFSAARDQKESEYQGNKSTNQTKVSLAQFVMFYHREHTILLSRKNKGTKRLNSLPLFHVVICYPSLQEKTVTYKSCVQPNILPSILSITAYLE